MDLDTLQSQMKVVIQKHQMVVTEMKKDPQNSVLQKQLRDLNCEIVSLSAQQKDIMQQLRSNLQKKQCAITTSSVTKQSAPLPVVAFSPPQVKVVCAAQKHTTNHRLTTPVNVHAVAVTQKQLPNFVNSLHQTVPPTINNLVSQATLTFKAPLGVVLPNCSNALLTTKVMDHQKLRPLLVVPSPSARGPDGTSTGVFLNLGPPIRVPQYPPPAPRPIGLSNLPKLQPPGSCVPVNVTFAAATCVSSAKVASPTATEKPLNSPPLTCAVIPSSSSSNLRPSCSVEKFPFVDPKKKEFMVALGLVSKDCLHDMKNKKAERKRRTTANPQFSNAALEEKLRNAAAAAQSLGPPVKRPRGRPRLDSKIPQASSSNGICPITESTTNSSTSPTASRPSSTPSPVPVPVSVNGIHRQLSPEEDKKVEELLSGLCMVCTQPGDLVKCDSCAKQQHPACMQPPLLTRPEGQWQCSDCQSRADSIASVHSYDKLKAAKEDDKRKLLKKSLELRLKRSQLEGKLFQLKDLSNKQKSRQSDLQVSLKKLEDAVEFVHKIMCNIKKIL